MSLGSYILVFFCHLDSFETVLLKFEDHFFRSCECVHMCLFVHYKCTAREG